MNAKNTGAILTLIAMALGGPVAVDKVVDATINTPATVLVFDAPESAVVGELVKISFSGDKAEWILPVEDSIRIDSHTVAMSFRNPGTYQVIASGIVDGAVRISTIEIKVAGEPTVAVPDEKPIPTPIEVIVVPTPPVSVLERTLADDVYDWCVDANSPKETCVQLADNFIAAASNTSSVTELISKTAALNRDVDQTGVEDILARAQAKLIAEYKGKSFIEHQCAWDEIAQGFYKYAGR